MTQEQLNYHILGLLADVIGEIAVVATDGHGAETRNNIRERLREVLNNAESSGILEVDE